MTVAVAVISKIAFRILRFETSRGEVIDNDLRINEMLNTTEGCKPYDWEESVGLAYQRGRRGSLGLSARRNMGYGID